MTRVRTIVLGFALVGGCVEPPTGRAVTGLESLALTSVNPSVAIAGTTLSLAGRSFVAAPVGISYLRLVGRYGDRNVDIELPATFVDFESLDVVIDEGATAELGGLLGSFDGMASVVVDFVPRSTRHSSAPLSTHVEFEPMLTPRLDSVLTDAAIFVNEPIAVAGAGLLLGGLEGTTVAIVEGCFTRLGQPGACARVGPVEIPVVPAQPHDREHGAFAFGPEICGIFPGAFEGTVQLRNVHAGGVVTQSVSQSLHYDLVETTITGSGAGGSVGQYVDIEGGGFVGGDDGLTILEAQGTYTTDQGGEAVVVEDLFLIPEFVDGAALRYVIDEQDDLGQRLAPYGGARYAAGTFVGSVQPIVQYGTDEFIGPSTPLAFRIEPVKQVVWIDYSPTYVDSLNRFGLRAMDRDIRARVVEVLRRDYATINVEFRDSDAPPSDFKLFAEVEVAGPDPNGLGLLGYDNTPGKDVGNLRLFDRIGGVNALTQQDGYPGYGGVFIESVLTFSEHPPAGIEAEAGHPLFDALFDPLRPDRGGTEVTSADFAAGPFVARSDAVGCPATDRRDQVACAVFVLGSIVGSTVSHELGHSLGLADPLGTRFHNLGDTPGRLMDQGGARSFEERAELLGQGPSVFCDLAYDYLREILPTADADTPAARPRC